VRRPSFWSCVILCRFGLAIMARRVNRRHHESIVKLKLLLICLLLANRFLAVRLGISKYRSFSVVVG